MAIALGLALTICESLFTGGIDNLIIPLVAGGLFTFFI